MAIKDKETTLKAKRPAALAKTSSVIKKASSFSKPRSVKKPADKLEAPKHPVEDITIAETPEVTATVALKMATVPQGKYVFATGRRKTAVANVRVFSGSAESTVNKKKFDVYFFHNSFREHALKAFQLTGMQGSYYFTASIFGGGMQAQAHALQHGLARALSEINPEIRTVLKRNGLLTRDDRKKERKKPGLKRARRAGQWAKR